MKFYAAAVLLALVAVAQGGLVRSDADTRILGGSDADLGQFPWHVHIAADNGAFFCGGAVLSMKWVLTAGHCVDGITTFTLVFGNLLPGSSSGNPGIQVSQSRTHQLHTLYNAQTIENDIGLIGLEADLFTSPTVGAVALPSHEQSGESFAGMDAAVSGWGKTSFGATGYAETLQWVELPVTTNALCNVTYSTIKSTHLCASGQNGRSTCIGDSGSPMVLLEGSGDYILIGILSYDYLNCERDYPAVFTRVTAYLDWIETHTDIVIPKNTRRRK